MTADVIAYRINTVHDVAPWGRSTTYKLVKEGKLPAKRLGGATFILREELEQFIKQLPAASPEHVTGECEGEL